MPRPALVIRPAGLHRIVAARLATRQVLPRWRPHCARWVSRPRWLALAWLPGPVGSRRYGSWWRCAPMAARCGCGSTVAATTATHVLTPAAPRR